MPIRSGTCYWEMLMYQRSRRPCRRGGSDVRLEITHWTKHFLMVLDGTPRASSAFEFAGYDLGHVTGLKARWS